MTLQEFIDRLREDFLDDTVEPYYWSDDTLLRYANDAEEEACRRANLLITDNDPNMCLINVTAGNSKYTLHPKILYILNAYNDTLNYPMYQVEKVALDNEIPNWKSLKSDTPKWFFIDDLNTLTIVPEPNKDFQLRLTVSHLPLTQKQITDSFEIPAIYHSTLLYWAAFLALTKKDINTDRREGAKVFADLFESAFGKRDTAKSEIKRKRIPRLTYIRPASYKLGFP